MPYALSGTASCAPDQTLTGDGANQSVSGTAIDEAGNSQSVTLGGINIDRTPPTISATADRAANANGWYSAPVTVTFTEAVTVVRNKFGLREMVMVGDRGMITSARIDALRELGGMSWLTCLRAPQIAKLAADDGPLQMSLFDTHDLAEIDHHGHRSEDRLFPGSYGQTTDC